MHLLNVFDVAADWNLVSRLHDADPRQDAQVSHLLHRLSDFVVNRRGQARLVPIVQLAGVVDELRYKRRIFPVQILFGHASHVALADLASGHRPIDEGCWLFSFKREHALASSNDVVPSILRLGVVKRVFVAVLLLVLPGWRSRIVVLAEFVILLGHTLGLVDSEVLAQGLFDDSVCREFFVRIDEHLAHCPR